MWQVFTYLGNYRQANYKNKIRYKINLNVGQKYFKNNSIKIYFIQNVFRGVNK